MKCVILKLCSQIHVGRNVLNYFNKSKIWPSHVNYLNQQMSIYPIQQQYNYYSKTPETEIPVDKYPEGRYSIKVWQGRQPSKDRKPYRNPVDWLPFEWHRVSRINLFEETGDIERMPEVDLSLPKPDFDLSDELKHASDQLKTIFSVKTASRHELCQAELDHLVRQVQQHPLDFTSLEVLVTRWTVRIRFLFRAQAVARKPKAYNVRLHDAIHRRNQYLRILHMLDRDKFNWLVKILRINWQPPPVELPLIRYTKKWDLRRLTKEYCKKQKQEKLSAYHAELKSMQEAFLREKEETLAWIAKEEKELGVHEANEEVHTNVK